MVTLYGIPNCDTIRKARKWLDQHNIEYIFHDFRKDGIEAGQIENWSKQVGWGTLLNRRGTTWRQLPDADRENMDARKAIRLMTEHPAMIKRPVLVMNRKCTVGFQESTYQALFT